MILDFFKRFSGAHYRQFYRRAQPVVAKINALEKDYQGLTDEQLKAKTPEFMARVQAALDKLAAKQNKPLAEVEPALVVKTRQAALDAVLPEAFAAVKNAARRLRERRHEFTVCGQPMVWDMVHYDVQLIGGMALHENKIAEMATGEGKTLVATLPLYLNALANRNCQLVTVNDYLARRDSEWMGQVYTFLGLQVGCIQNWMGPTERRAAYGCHITYGTAAEFGFDYLRDNGMALSTEQQVQRDHFYAIIDEVDSILIDEARTPLIISGPANYEREAPFREYRALVEGLVRNQVNLCNRLIGEAKAEWEKVAPAKPDVAKALDLMYQVKLGSPKSKVLLRLLEDGRVRKLFEAHDLEMQADYNKEKVLQMKEELFYAIDERHHQADLTEKGRNFLQPDDPDAYVLPDLPTMFSDIDRRKDMPKPERDQLKLGLQQRFEVVSERIHTISQLLRAYGLYERDVHYVVQEGKVMIVDENTGRIMPGRRWSDGLHQAVEAKEDVEIEKETKTYATITIQNYFRQYEKLAGMTGTAETEAGEFRDIYNLTVMVIPTNKPSRRVDQNDIIYKTRREKYNAVIKAVEEAYAKGQPVLVGTASVEASEVVSRLLRRTNIPHTVLNAKMHQQEAEIVARAGQKGAVTISTNMAGRGTDIKLGAGVAELGGLFVVGTERHQARRVDRQLRGRSARQGDPGLTRFYLSLEDDLMRLYSRSKFANALLSQAIKEGEPLEDQLLNGAISQAQKNVEQIHYATRKRLLGYDDVLNKQREVVYGLRNEVMHNPQPRATLFELVEEEVAERVNNSGAEPNKHPDAESLDSLLLWANGAFPIGIRTEEATNLDGPALQKLLLDRIREAYETKAAAEDPEGLLRLERNVVIGAIDRNWQDHLTEMDDLRQSVGLRGYGQRDPLNEYKAEAYKYFEQMMESVRGEVCRRLFTSATSIQAFEAMLANLAKRVQMTGPDGNASGEAKTQSAAPKAPPAAMPRPAAPAAMPRPGTAPASGAATMAPAAAPAPAKEIVLPKLVAPRKVVAPAGRNDACPCGSGKKYKKCCGKDA